MRGELWRRSVGVAPHVVTVEERAAKGHRLYLRWWDTASENWRWKSTGLRLVGTAGRERQALEQAALEAARAQCAILTGQRPAPTDAPLAPPLTLGRTWAVVADPGSGKYPADTPHRREVAAALDHAIRYLGADFPWALLTRAKYRELGRRRVQELQARGHTGQRGAEVLIARLATVAAWLREEGHIGETDGLPGTRWKDDLAAFLQQTLGDAPEPKRLRYTVEESRRLLAAAWDVDPRYGLLLALGAELRLGQVRRARRSDLDIARGTFRVRGRGRKRGETIELTAGQLAAVYRALGGYLAPLEVAAADYPLFPQGQLLGGRRGVPRCRATHAEAAPIERRTWNAWHRETEALAQVEHIPGRGPYGIRRVSVDRAKELGVSREGLKALGGWSDTQVPDRIYAEQEQGYAQREAATVRAKIRGES